SRLPHCWYSTVTLAFVFAVKRAFASSTTSFQLDWASTMSQTLIVLPSPLALLLVSADLLHAAAPISVAASAAAIAIFRLTRSSLKKCVARRECGFGALN